MKIKIPGIPGYRRQESEKICISDETLETFGIDNDNMILFLFIMALADILLYLNEPEHTRSDNCQSSDELAPAQSKELALGVRLVTLEGNSRH